MGLMSIGFTNPAPPPIIDPAADAEYWSRQVAACSLIEELAGWYGIHSDTVWRCLSEVSDDELWMLDSPGGWSLLGGFVAARLGINAQPYAPVVH